jgi:DNA recombination protein RmuC
MAGMVAYCDFIEQATFDSESGRMRPDLIVKLPNGRSIVIDAKSPLQAYLEGLDSEDEEVKNAKMK